jgi:hypothetical protein
MLAFLRFVFLRHLVALSFGTYFGLVALFAAAEEVFGRDPFGHAISNQITYVLAVWIALHWIYLLLGLLAARFVLRRVFGDGRPSDAADTEAPAAPGIATI